MPDLPPRDPGRWSYLEQGSHTTSGNICSAAADIRLAIQNGELSRAHPFEYACAKADIDHRLTKPRHPWTNGQAERMNRTIKDATVKRYHYDTHDHLREHLNHFVAAYNYARRLKTLNGLTPYEFICKTWQSEPKRFTLDPLHQMPGLNMGGARDRSHRDESVIGRTMSAPGSRPINRCPQLTPPLSP